MPPDPWKLTYCEGKKAFASRYEALAVMRRRRKRYNRGEKQGALEAYRCPICGKWHLGTPSR